MQLTTENTEFTEKFLHFVVGGFHPLGEHFSRFKTLSFSVFSVFSVPSVVR